MSTPRDDELAAIEAELRAAYEAPAPAEAPDTYPGPVPAWSFRLHHEGITFLQPYQVERRTAGRQPVLAVGSNASPAQLRHKFWADVDLLASLPVTRAIVTGVAAVYTPYRAGYGSVPTTAHLDPTMRSVLSVLWLDDDQLEHLHQTERGAYRVGLVGRAEGVSAEVEGIGTVADDLVVYVSAHGTLLVDDEPAACASFVGYAGERPLRSFTQPEIVDVLRESTDDWPDHGGLGTLSGRCRVDAPPEVRAA